MCPEAYGHISRNMLLYMTLARTLWANKLHAGKNQELYEPRMNSP